MKKYYDPWLCVNEVVKKKGDEEFSAIPVFDTILLFKQ
jgi:hypothetical protein